MLALVGAVLTMVGQARGAEWTRITPDGGELRDLAQSPANPSRLWATSGVSVVRSDDRGDTWLESTTFPQPPQGIEVDAVAMDTAYAIDVEFAANGEPTSRVHRTTDGGAIWTALTFPGTVLDVVRAHPTVAGLVFVGVGDTISRSTDHGGTWTGSASLGSGLAVTVIAPSASAQSIVYAGTRLAQPHASGQGIHKSVDGGATWTRTSAVVDSVIACAVDPTNADVVYASDIFPGNIVKSIDGGGTWQQIGAGLAAAGLVVGFAIDPDMPSRVYAVAENDVFVSVDGGLTFVPTSSGLDVNAAPHDLAIDRTATTRLVAASRRGVARSDDAAATWSHHASGVPDGAATGIGIPANDPDTILLGSSVRGAYRSIDAGVTWQVANGGLEGLDTARIAVGAASTHLAFAVGRPVYPTRVARTVDHGASWSDVPAAAVGQFVEDIAVAPSDDLVVYGADGASEANPRPLLKSIDGGATWSRLPVAGLTGSFPRVVVDPTDADVVYLFTHYRVAKSVDGGAQWTVHNIFFLPNAAHVESAAIDPRDPARLVAGVRDNLHDAADKSGVYLSTDGGVTWRRVHTRSADAVAVHPVDGRIIAASDDGVLASDDDGATWTDLTGTLPHGRPQALVATAAALFVTPLDAGLFRLDIGPCTPAPATGCRASTVPGAARMQWKHATPANATLRVTLGRLGALGSADLGLPETSDATTYGVCVYDRSGPGGASRLVTSTTAPGGDECGAPPCWRRTGVRLRYRDRARRPDGLADLWLRTGGDRKRQIGAVGQGPLLSLSPVVVPPVVVQVRRADAAECWDATFATRINRNDGIAFQARSD